METLRLLVVDDEPGMRMGVARALRDFVVVIPDMDLKVELEVDSAESGEVALERIKESPPDILLLDHKLPGMTGLDVLERMGPQRERILTVMITAYASVDTAVTAIKRGAYDFLAKPFTPAELKATVRKAAESLVITQQARKLAQEKRAVRFQFISVLAHELKAPLAAIEGFMNIIKDRTAGDDMSNYENMVARCLLRVDGMRRLILDLLDMTRIESGQKKRDIVELELHEIAVNTIETFAALAAERGISMHLHGEECIQMAGDRGEIEIIFNNLVSNAIKYNRDNGKVDVTLTSENGRARIVVADTGIGMSKEEAEKLFQDFVRIKNEKTRNILGSGLGLSIVRKIAYIYNGDITVDSEPDVGSTFTVVLERQAEKQNDKPLSAEPEPGELDGPDGDKSAYEVVNESAGDTQVARARE